MASIAQDEVKGDEDGDDPNNYKKANHNENPNIDNEPRVMWSIGYNTKGQHGDGTTRNVVQLKLHQWAKDLDIVKVVNGYGFSSYICRDGSLWVSGMNDCGQLGLGNTTSPVTTCTKNDFFAKKGIELRNIESGNYCYHQISMTSNGELYAVGRNQEYQLGISDDKSDRSQFTELTYFRQNALCVRQITCSHHYSTFLTNDGGVYVCGTHSNGGLGFGAKVTECKSIRPIDALKAKPMTHIASGKDHTLSIDKDGYVWSWGNNENGELGHGHNNTTKEDPKMIQYFVDNKIETTQIACGRWHNLSLGINHRVYAWGRNVEDQIGDGTASPALTPKMIQSLQNVDIVDVKAFSHHNVAMSRTYDFYLWGANSWYQCITGNTSKIQIPTKFNSQTIPAFSNAVVLSVQPGYHSTNVFLALDTLTLARKKIHESTDYISMVPPNVLPQLLRDEVHETHRLTEEKNMVNQQLDDLETDNKSQKEEIESMSKEMKKLNEKIEEQKNKEQSLKKQLKRTKKEIESHQKSLKAHETQIQSESREIDGLRKEATAQQQQFRSLQEKLQIQEEQNVSMVQQMKHLKEKVQSQEKENQSITMQLKGLQKDVQVRDGNIEKMKKQIKSQQKARKVREKENQSKTQQIVQLQERLQDKDQEERAARQTLRTREEENMSMVQQLQRLQQDAELRTADTNRLHSEIAENQRKLKQQEEEKLLMTNQLKQIRNEGIAKDQNTEALEERLRRSYTLRAVQDESKQTDVHVNEDENKVQGQERTHEDGALYKKHCDIVTEWNILTEKLEKLAEPLKKGDDEEKQPSEQEQGGLSVDDLLSEYENAYRLINQQKGRLKQLEDSNLSELISHQNKLSKSVKKLDSELSSKKEETVQKNERYKKIKVSRKGIVSLIEKTVNQCNQLIDSENKLSAELKVLNKETNAVKVQLETAKSSSADCADTISLYAVFGEQNQKHIDMISNHYSAEWESFESRCFEWSAHELVVHLRRIAASVVVDEKESTSESQDDDVEEQKHESNAVWDSVEKKLAESKISGKHLPHFGPHTVSYTGIMDKAISVALVSSISRLVQRRSAEFDKLWREIEAKWMEWTPQELTEWLKYQALHLEGGLGAIDWEMTTQLFTSQQLNGQKLPKITEVMFPFVGITDKRVSGHLVSSIYNLLNQSDAKSRDQEIKSLKIPPEFLCPITRQIMKDPVLASDGHTYERANIEPYLKQHNKSPVTGEPMQHTFVFPNHSVKQLIEKFLSENKHVMEELIAIENAQEGAEQEGVQETGYI